jgi:hypothetical protein
MTELVIPTMAYRPTGVNRPRAWKWHLQRGEGEWVRTVCGLTLGLSESALIADIPMGELCRQCLGAMKEK